MTILEIVAVASFFAGAFGGLFLLDMRRRRRSRMNAMGLVFRFQNHAAECVQCARAGSARRMCPEGEGLISEAWRRL